MNTRSGSSNPVRLVLAALVALAVVGFTGCSNDSTSESAKESTTTSAAAESTTTTAAKAKLKILVSNDDGYNAPGIDALVRALSDLPDTEVVVAAPATQQSGKGSSVTEGELKATEEKMLGGHPVFAVQGTPADSVNWALDGGIDLKPDLVITGINAGQNLGAIADQISGTVGAARAATARGIPALATSLGSVGPQNINDPGPDSAFELAATFVVDWVKEHRDDLLAGKYAGDSPLLENLNVPLCTTGEPRGVAEVTLSPGNENAVAAQDCASTVAQPADDINAFINGFVTISSVPLARVGG